MWPSLVFTKDSRKLDVRYFRKDPLHLHRIPFESRTFQLALKNSWSLTFLSVLSPGFSLWRLTASSHSGFRFVLVHSVANLSLAKCSWIFTLEYASLGEKWGREPILLDNATFWLWKINFIFLTYLSHFPDHSTMQAART